MTEPEWQALYKEWITAGVPLFNSDAWLRNASEATWLAIQTEAMRTAAQKLYPNGPPQEVQDILARMAITTDWTTLITRTGKG